MKSYDVLVEAESWIKVEADSEQEAKDAAVDIFIRSTSLADRIDTTVMDETEID